MHKIPKIRAKTDPKYARQGVQSHRESTAGVLDGFWGQYRYILDHRKKSEQKILFHHGENIFYTKIKFSKKIYIFEKSENVDF